MARTFPRVVVQRWEEHLPYATICKTCDRRLAVFHNTRACPFCGEVYQSQFSDARLGALLTEAFPNLRIVSGPRWIGYMQPRPNGTRRSVPKSVPDPPAEDDIIEVLQLFDPVTWPGIESAEP